MGRRGRLPPIPEFRPRINQITDIIFYYLNLLNTILRTGQDNINIYIYISITNELRTLRKDEQTASDTET